MAPWRGPRHRSWASDTNLSLLFAFAIVAGYVIWELFGEAPQGMVTLVGLAGGALLGGLSGDRRKRESERDDDMRDTRDAARRAEVKADDAQRTAHAGDERAGVLEERADRSQERESEHSLHVEHQDDADDDRGGRR